MSVRKKFDKQMYDMVDGPAKNALVKILESQGHTIVDTSETYYADVVSEKGGVTYYNEAEVKLGWKGDWNPTWTEIRIPERKKRLKEKYKDDTGVLNFYIFSNGYEYAWRIKDTQLTEEGLKEAKGRYIKKGERFFHIPYKEAELITC